MKPETKQSLLPAGLLVGALVCGGICWLLDGVVFWVFAALALAMIIAGTVFANRADAARRRRHDEGHL